MSSGFCRILKKFLAREDGRFCVYAKRTISVLSESGVSAIIRDYEQRELAEEERIHGSRHCEKRSNEAIHTSSYCTGLLRCARNDGVYTLNKVILKAENFNHYFINL
jgi:hypothetical protein